jgi:hypothetical protein
MPLPTSANAVASSTEMSCAGRLKPTHTLMWGSLTVTG